MTKSRSTLPAFAILAFALAALSAKADTLTISSNPYSDSYGGGEFTIVSTSPLASNASYNALARGAGGNGFESFCLEYSEHFSPGSMYDFTRGSAAFGGDLPAGFDTLSVGTAWLYSQFATGTLAGYDYTAANRAASALQLQLAFWYLEDETTLAAFVQDHGVYNPATNAFLSAAFTYFGTETAAHADNANGGYGVYVLNLTSDQGRTQNQSQTYYRVPDSGSSLLMFGTAAAGLLALRRRRTAKS